jgi:dipeptide/tripeptide permease
VVLLGLLAAVYFRAPAPWNWILGAVVLLAPVVIALLPGGARRPVLNWVAAHPLADAKFFFFIFALIPVQTLFTYNWLVLPQYISRSFAGWIGQYYEIFSNANPVLIFILVPVITALTYKAKEYNMMVWGTLVMGSSAFILALGPTPLTLLGYIVMMTIGEAMWSARFLQYATEIAPEGRAGQYQGVAQLPWFLTKFLVPLLYSGQMMERYCPKVGQQDTRTMWFIFGLIAVITPVSLLLAKNWIGRDISKKSEAASA